MNYKFILLVFSVLSYVSVYPVMGETVYLKDGTTVEGKIITDEPGRIQVDVGGIPRTISRGEIERISGGAAGETLTDLQNKNVRALKDIPESKRMLINRLLDANGARESMHRTFAQILESAPAESRKMLAETINLEELIKQITPLYDKYYSDQELKDMVAFYSSPAGKKVIQATPFLVKDVLNTTAAYFKSKAGTPPVKKP